MRISGDRFLKMLANMRGDLVLAPLARKRTVDAVARPQKIQQDNCQDQPAVICFVIAQPLPSVQNTAKHGSASWFFRARQATGRPLAKGGNVYLAGSLVSIGSRVRRAYSARRRSLFDIQIRPRALAVF